jgi:hypothetical protein
VDKRARRTAPPQRRVGAPFRHRERRSDEQSAKQSRLIVTQTSSLVSPFNERHEKMMRGGRTRKAKIRASHDDGDPASMRRRPTKQLVTAAFDIVKTVGLALPDVEATTKYDGSPVLRVDGIFMAGLATHPSAEPETLVVRAGLEERERLVEDGPRRTTSRITIEAIPWCWSVCRASDQTLCTTCSPCHGV